MATSTTVPIASAWADPDRWDAEYRDAAIPSSWRSRPARALTALLPFVALDRTSTVLDLGCGTGRNAAHLAAIAGAVHAVDCSAVAIAGARERLDDQGLKNVSLDRDTLGIDSVPTGSYDLILDSYVSCHLLDPDQRHEHLDQAMRQLAPGGCLLTIGLGSGDSYYERWRIGESGVTVDPCNGVAKLLQPEDIAARDGDALGTVRAQVTLAVPDTVSGRCERRQIHATLLERPR